MKRIFASGGPVKHINIQLKKKFTTEGLLVIDLKSWLNLVDFYSEDDYLTLHIYKNGEKLDTLSDDSIVYKIVQQARESSDIELKYSFSPGETLLISASISVTRKILESIVNSLVKGENLGTNNIFSEYDFASVLNEYGFLEQYLLHILSKILKIELKEQQR